MVAKAFFRACAKSLVGPGRKSETPWGDTLEDSQSPFRAADKLSTHSGQAAGNRGPLAACDFNFLLCSTECNSYVLAQPPY
jgi:hypothetical protein